MGNGNAPARLSYEALLELKRWNTPSVYNGWEAITQQESREGPLQPGRDARLHAADGADGRLCGDRGHRAEQSATTRRRNPNVWSEYRRYVAGVPGPKIVVVQDLDKPQFVGAYWGEVNSNTHRALGCVGTIVDGAIRDVDEMCNAGFKALAKRTSVGHAYSVPVRWNCDVEVFGCPVRPGQLIHADKHGFLVVPEEDEAALLDACRFMDANECRTLIPAARATAGKTMDEILRGMDEAGRQFDNAARARFGAKGEW